MFPDVSKKCLRGGFDVSGYEFSIRRVSVSGLTKNTRNSCFLIFRKNV